MRFPYRLLLLYLLAAVLPSCASPTRGLLLYRGASTHPQFATPGADKVEVTYLGVGGYVVRRGSDALMFAPSFTNPAFFSIPSTRSDPDLVDRCMRRVGSVQDVQWILVGHAHYDHLMDVPRVMAEHAPQAIAVGSQTTSFYLSPAHRDRTLVVDDCAARAEERPGKWIYNQARTLRILPIVSEHSPHWWILKFMSGHQTRPLTRLPGSASDWKEGQTYAYLVDFLDQDGRVVFRIHYQDAASTYPLGSIPEHVKQEYPQVDLAILCVGAHVTAPHYPSLILKNTQPRYILLGHWEDFFANQACQPDDPPAQVVRQSDIHDFIRRVERHKRKEAEWLIPYPYTTSYFPLTSAASSLTPPVPMETCPALPGSL